MNNSNFRVLIFSILISLILVQCKTHTQEEKVEDIKKPMLISEKAESFKDHYPSGKLKTEGQFINHKKTGKWISYYENGEEKAIRNYKEGKLDGYQKMDYSQVLCMEGSLKMG